MYSIVKMGSISKHSISNNKKSYEITFIKKKQKKVQKEVPMGTSHFFFEVCLKLHLFDFLLNITGEQIEIPSGRQVYNFTCTLPPVLPSSFEGEFGYVRYTVKVTLDCPWAFDQETKMAFTVINALDLNLNPSYKVPVVYLFISYVLCLCVSALIIL